MSPAWKRPPDPENVMSWRLIPEETALLVIDVQERLVPAMDGGEALVKRVADAVAVARLFGLPVFHSEQVPAKLGPTVAAVRDALVADATPARTKHEFSAAGCFAAGELPGTVLVAGIEAHVCVRQTVFDLRERGHAVYLLADAVASRAESDKRLALHELREIARARVTTLETVAWELLGKTEGERFKKLLAILK